MNELNWHKYCKRVTHSADTQQLVPLNLSLSTFGLGPYGANKQYSKYI